MVTLVVLTPSLERRIGMKGNPMLRSTGLLILASFFLLSGICSCTSKEEKKARHLNNARQYIEKNELQKAVIELKNVTQLDPEDDEAYSELGKTYLKLKQGHDALQAFLKATSINPKNLKAQLKIGQILLIGRRPVEARKKAELVLQDRPDDTEALGLLSGVQVQEKDIDGGLATLKKALSVNPRDFNTHLSMARIFLMKADHGRAERSYLESISLSPRSNAPYVELSHLYAAKGEIGKAEETLKNMIQAAGENYPNLQILAFFYESTGQWDQAEKTHLLCADSVPKEDVSPLMSLGSYYARRNSYDKAVASMSKALEIRKGDLEVMSSIAQLHFDFKHFEEAGRTADRILEKDKGHIAANLLKGKLELAGRDYSGALEKFDRVIRDRPRSDTAYYYRAVTLIHKGEPRLAEPDLLKAVELNPRFLEARLILAETYLRGRNKDLARQQIESAQKIAPTDAMVISLLGNLKVLERNLGAAEEAFKRLVELHPNESGSYVRLGAFYGTTGNIPEAEKNLRKALELDPEQIEAHGLVTGIYVRQKKYDEALRLCDLQRQRVGKNSQALAFVEYLQGRILFARGEGGKALHHFEKAIETDPQILGAYEAMAQIHLSEKRLAQAKGHYESIITRNPKYIPGHMALGAIYEQMGDRKQAEISYRKALAVDREFAPAANNLAWTLVDAGGNIDEALGLAQSAKQKMPKNSAVMDTLGWIYYLKGSYLNAISELQDAVQMDSNNAVIQFHLGMAYYKNNQIDRAVESLEKALSIDHSFKGADQARNLLKEIKTRS
jgi:tetratricopeptide (TPR) repeat protein